jgi:hypothetical protein
MFWPGAAPHKQKTKTTQNKKTKTRDNTNLFNGGCNPSAPPPLQQKKN